MNDKLKIFLDNKKDAERKMYEKKKEETLINLGLYEKVYSSANTYSAEYPIAEWNNATHTNKYFKKVPIDITDEEFKEVQIYANKKDHGQNPVAIALEIIAAIIFVAGFVAGILLGTVEVERGSYYTYTDTEFSFAIAFVYWGASLISGTIFLAFAEIIKLLDAINIKLFDAIKKK